MALPADIQPNGDPIRRTGNVLALLAGDLRCSIVLERAPDSGGSPGTWAVIAVLPPGPQIYRDYLPLDTLPRWYRFLHRRIGRDDSGYSTPIFVIPRGVISEEPYRIPDYPVIQVEQESPATRPGNVLVRLRDWPDHADTAIYYAYLEIADAVPPLSTTSGDWTLYAGDVELSRDVAVSRKLAAWGDLNRIWSHTAAVVEVGPDPRAQLLGSNVTESGSSPNIRLARTVEVDPQTATVQVFRRRANWPTEDATQTGTPDVAFLKDEIDALDGWTYADTGWATGNTIYDVFVPLDANGNAGVRQEYSYTITAVPVPMISTANRVLTTAGTSCSVRRQYTVSWTTANVTDGSHDMRIYRRITGGEFDGSWSLLSTEVSPVTNTSYLDTVPAFPSSWAGPPDPPTSNFLVDYRLDLWDGASVDDSRLLSSAKYEPGGFEGEDCL